MNISAKLAVRADRNLKKRNEKKRQIADSALEALKQLGYANTSLRDIAAISDLSLGMLHYYFEDKFALISYCVENYKLEFVADLNAALDRAEGRDGVIDAFCEALVRSIIDDEATHRLWYDIRTQAMFDPAFRGVVTKIERLLIEVVGTVIEKAGKGVTGDTGLSYAMLDGLFRYVMQQQISGKRRNREEIEEIFRSVLDRLL